VRGFELLGTVSLPDKISEFAKPGSSNLIVMLAKKFIIR